MKSFSTSEGGRDLKRRKIAQNLAAPAVYDTRLNDAVDSPKKFRYRARWCEGEVGGPAVEADRLLYSVPPSYHGASSQEEACSCGWEWFPGITNMQVRCLQRLGCHFNKVHWLPERARTAIDTLKAVQENLRGYR